MTTVTRPTDQNFATPTEQHESGIWGEQMTQEGLREVVFRRPLPVQLIERYSQLAARHAIARQLEDGTWLAEIEGFVGVWGDGASQKEALDALEEVVFDWVLLKLRDEDRDLPVIESLDLNSL